MVKPSEGGLESQKTKFPAKATSGFGGMEIPPGSFWGWSLFHAVQITVSSTPLSWGGNEMNSAQSPVSGLALFPKVRKPSFQPKQHLAKAAWNSLLAVLGSGPFSIQFKTQFPAHHCRGGGNELSSVQSPVFETWNSFLQRNTDDSSSVAL